MPHGRDRLLRGLAVSLKWKKDGTAKCGPCEMRVWHWGGQPRPWLWREESQIDEKEAFGNSTTMGYATTETKAKAAAEEWLRAQAEKMLKDLGQRNEGGK